MMKVLFRFFFLLLCAGCDSTDFPITILVSETEGLDRNYEYITTTISLANQCDKNLKLIATDLTDKSTVMVEVFEVAENENCFEYEVLFPVQVSANETKKYQINILEKGQDELAVELLLSEDKLSIENKNYKVHFSSEDDKRGGQINGIELKNFENQLLKRGHIPMHWAPNFSKSNSEAYFNMEDLPPDSKHALKNKLFRVIKERSGFTDSVPEIHLEGRYEFYADLPYFLFESTMTIKKDVELNLLRNDEMTMDSLFTHVAYPKKDGSIERLNLYNEELDNLDKNPISDDAEWVAFYNKNKGYGFSSIRLNYDNLNVNRSPSPVHKPYTKISKSSGNGRYWNRVLADTLLQFPKGSRYYEKNAYLIFQVNANFPEKEVLHYYKCLKKPLKVEVDVK